MLSLWIGVIAVASRRLFLSAVSTSALAVQPKSLALAAPPRVAAPDGWTPSAAQEFWSGLLAGAVQKTAKELVLHPLDTAKARLQFAGNRRMALKELFQDPYAGLVPAIVSGAPAAATFFAVKDAAKRAVKDLKLGKTETTLFAVSCANVAYWGIKNPSEVLKVRRQAGVADDTLSAATELWRAEGLGGFYKSVGPNFAYSTPVDCTKFLLYESFKTQRRVTYGTNSLSPIEAAVAGAISASVAQAIATPLDVARVRIMTSDMTGVVDTIRTIATTEGVGALYAGVTPKVVRALAAGAIQFSTYEVTKEWATLFLARRFPNL